jgi:hypothetical protein
METTQVISRSVLEQPLNQGVVDRSNPEIPNYRCWEPNRVGLIGRVVLGCAQGVKLSGAL